VHCSRDLTAVADEWNVTVLLDNVIYRLLGQLKVCTYTCEILSPLFHGFYQDHVEKMLPPIEAEEVLGEAEVLEMFKLTGARKANVAGCKITTGYLLKDKKFIVFRNNEPVCQGKLVKLVVHSMFSVHLFREIVDNETSPK